jgi:hypothetical protein
MSPLRTVIFICKVTCPLDLVAALVDAPLLGIF